MSWRGPGLASHHSGESRPPDVRPHRGDREHQAFPARLPRPRDGLVAAGSSERAGVIGRRKRAPARHQRGNFAPARGRLFHDVLPACLAHHDVLSCCQQQVSWCRYTTRPVSYGRWQPYRRRPIATGKRPWHRCDATRGRAHALRPGTCLPSLWCGLWRQICPSVSERFRLSPTDCSKYATTRLGPSLYAAD